VDLAGISLSNVGDESTTPATKWCWVFQKNRGYWQIYKRILAENDRGNNAHRFGARAWRADASDHRADLVVEGKVIVASKVAERIVPVHEMQLLNYLKATGINLGLILNFGPRPTFRRMLLSSPQEGSVVIRA
jgi:hypothetical protein